MHRTNPTLSDTQFAAVERRFIAARQLRQTIDAAKENERRYVAVAERLKALLETAQAEYEAAGAECRKEGMPC